MSIGTRVDIFQLDKMEDGGVIPGRGGHLKALSNDTAWLTLLKEPQSMMYALEWKGEKGTLFHAINIKI